MENPNYIVSSDLNGTCISQHSMSDMIRLYKGKNEFERAWELFRKQTNGEASMEDAFELAGELSRGITLRQIIEYTIYHMEYMQGFDELLDYISNNNGCFIFNSTGYSATIYCIQTKYGKDKIHGFIGNFLQLAPDADVQQTLTENEVEKLVISYFRDFNSVYDEKYDIIKATGEIILGIEDESAKTKLAVDYISRYFPELPLTRMLHMGDTMGDSGGILGFALLGAIGIGVNCNIPLKYYIRGCKDTNSSLYLYISESKNLFDIIHILDKAFV